MTRRQRAVQDGRAQLLVQLPRQGLTALRQQLDIDQAGENFTHQLALSN